MSTPTRAIFMACSRNKRQTPDACAYVYDGSPWRTLNNAINDAYRRRAMANRLQVPTVLVLSARYGFIDVSTVIEPYDELLTERRVAELLTDQAQIERLAGLTRHLHSILLAGGKGYRQAMARGLELAHFAGRVIDLHPRGIGDINGAIRRFVLDSPPDDTRWLM